MGKRAAVIRGDGVGPELTRAAVAVLEETGADVEYVFVDAGAEWWEAKGAETLIPDESWSEMKKADCVFKGPTTTPGGAGSPRSVAVSIRQHFDLYANVRPVRTFRGARGPLGPVDMVCVREASEGLCFGGGITITPDVGVALRRVSRHASRRIARYAFKEAERRGWDAVVAIHKSNILKESDGLFLEEVRAEAAEHRGVELLDYHVDNMAMQLVKNPQDFNRKVLLSTNLFMDVLSEECSALVGSIGMIYSANIGDGFAMFEPAHGSAPKYMGKDVVNPTATILACAWMLDYLGFLAESRAIFSACEDVVSEGKYVTYDLGGKAKSSQMIDAIAGHVPGYLK